MLDSVTITPEQLNPSNYDARETFSIPLEPTHLYSGLAYLPRHELALIYTDGNRNLLELRRIETNAFPVIRTTELNGIPASIDDFVWCEMRNELLLMSAGQLFSYNLDEEQLTNTMLIDAERNKSRLACNSTMIACVDSRTLKLYDVKTLKFLREKRLDHVCEDIELDDQYFLSTHTGKLEFLDRTLFSIRRFAIGGTSICRFNTKLWLIADTLNDRLLWQSLDKLLVTIGPIHQPKSIAVIPSVSRIVILCTDPNRLLIYDPIPINLCQ